MLSDYMILWNRLTTIRKTMALKRAMKEQRERSDGTPQDVLKYPH